MAGAGEGRRRWRGEGRGAGEEREGRAGIFLCKMVSLNYRLVPLVGPNDDGPPSLK